MSDQLIDQPSETRKGEALDEGKLLTYLKANLPDISDTLEIKQFPSGFSNLTYLIKSGQREFVLRKPPIGANIKSAHDMSREYKVLSLLKPVYDKIPDTFLYCDTDEVLGAPFYLMERVKGLILRGTIPNEFTESIMQGISKSAISNLANLHSINIHKSGLIDMGKPEGYIKRQVDGWSKRYFNAETDEIHDMNETVEWMKSNMPKNETAAFIHNDYKYDNLVLDTKTKEIKAVLDWEMATVGDPLMDLGTTLGYWAEAGDNPALKPFSLTWHNGNLTRQEVVAQYANHTNKDLNDIVFYYVFGCFKIGVIVQQIYARYKKGITQDPRFANLIYVVKACGVNASNAIKYKRINNFR